jgi:hypothetical protein
VGSIFSANEESILNWTTTFTVRLHEGTQPIYANGFAFVIQAISANALGVGGQGLGYQGIPDSVAVKFDTYTNGTENGTGGSTGLFFGGDLPTVAHQPGEVNLPLDATMGVNLESQSQKTITLSYAYNPMNPGASVLHEQILDADHPDMPFAYDYLVDIPALLDTPANGNTIGYVGLTGSTGSSDFWELQDVLGWRYTPAGPAAPHNLTAVATGDAVDLSWKCTSADEQGFYVERSTNPNTGFTRIATLGAGVTTYHDAGLTNPQQYYYHVQAFDHDAMGNEQDSGFSNVASGAFASISFPSFAIHGNLTANTNNVTPPVNVFPGTPPVMRLTDGRNGEATSVFYNIPVGTGAFSTTFVLQDQPVSGAADSLSFVLQNDPRGTAALGGSGGAGGYGGVTNSFAVKLDLYTHGSHNPSTGLFTGGQAPDSDPTRDVPLTGINLGSHDPIQITLTYDGTTLTEVVQDPFTGATFSHSYALNLAQVIGGPSAYVGFTGGTGGENAIQDIVRWAGQFSLALPAAPSGLQGAATGPNDVTLAWTYRSPIPATGFVIERSLDNYHFSPVGDPLGAGITTFHDTGLTPGIYFYRVSAFNDIGTSPPSSAIQITVGVTVVTIDHSNGFDTTDDLQANGNAMFSPLPGAVGIFTAHQDIGAVATAGNATFADGVYSLRASGDDIFGTADAFHFVYMPLHGNGQIIARVTSLDPGGTISDFTKAGVMIRETLANDSREVSLVDTRDHSFRFQRRADPAGSTDRGPDSDYPDMGNPLPPPLWLRLQRQGNVFTASWAMDVSGMPGAWTQLDGPQTINMASDVFVGLALTAHNNDGSLNTATFDHVTVDTGAAAVLTDGNGSEASSIFKTQPVPVTGTFSTSFTLNVRPTSGSADGFTFVLQADPSGPTALGGSGGSLGYGGISPSVAIKLDLYSQGSHHSTTGLYFNGATGSAGQVDMTSAGIDFRQNHTYKMDLNYDGFVLSETLKDLVSGATFTTSYALDLRAAIGQDTAYVGFTGGTGGEAAVMAVTSWTGTFNPLKAPPHLEVKQFPTTEAGAPQVFTVSAKTAAGAPLTNYRATIHFTSTDPQALLPADYTFTVADNGTHTFAGVLFTAGPQSITATDNSPFALTDTQANILVTPGAAARLGVSGFPSPATAGATGELTVTAFDRYGNVVTGYTGTVHFTSSDGQATLPADYTFTAADNGSHTFAATLYTAGSQTITVTDTANSLITDTATVAVNPAAASYLVVAGFPSPASRMQAYTFTVTAYDGYGNVTTGYTGTVHFSSDESHANLPADYTFTAADAGTHTFSATFNRFGTFYLKATDTLDPSITGEEDGIQVV